jgi:hypothetical protein
MILAFAARTAVSVLQYLPEIARFCEVLVVRVN